MLALTLAPRVEKRLELRLKLKCNVCKQFIEGLPKDNVIKFDDYSHCPSCFQEAEDQHDRGWRITAGKYMKKHNTPPEINLFNKFINLNEEDKTFMKSVGVSAENIISDYHTIYHRGVKQFTASILKTIHEAKSVKELIKISKRYPKDLSAYQEYFDDSTECLHDISRVGMIVEHALVDKRILLEVFGETEGRIKQMLEDNSEKLS